MEDRQGYENLYDFSQVNYVKSREGMDTKTKINFD